MGNFKAAAALTVAAILVVSSFASQHHGPSPDSPDFRPPNTDGVLEESVIRFNHSVACTFSSLVFDVSRKQLIVSSRDHLFRLSLDRLALLEQSHWPADDKEIHDCQQKGQLKDDCHNFIRVLHVHGDRLLACGTNAFSPRCSWRPAKAINSILECFTGLARCPYSPHSHMSSLLSSGPDGTADLFIGSPTDFSGQDVAIFRLPLNSSVSTSTDSSSSGPQHGHLRTMESNVNWLNAAEFVASVEVDQFVFFFFREVAVEVSNCGKAVYSRVARVCKNDVGSSQQMMNSTWTTFVKARLNCSVPAEYPFYYDHIQSVAYVQEERLFYAAFTTAENSIAGSAVCSFTLDSMLESFAGPFKFQSSPTSTWESVNSTHAHSHCNSVAPSSSSLLEAAEKYQLMDRAVQPRPRNYGRGPLIQLDSVRFNHIAVDVVANKINSSIHVLYVASRDGLVRKYSVFPSTQEGCLVEIVDPFARFSHQLAHRQIKTMQFFKGQNALYIGTENEVIRLASQRCKRFASKTQCLNSVDPYCGWQSQLGECTPPPENNPHVSHWEQQPNLTSCPTPSTPEEKSVNGESPTSVGGEGVCGCNESSIIAKLAEQVKQGAPGPAGVDGKPGMTGIPGAQGQMGPTGPQGPAGEKGERGDSGPVGKEGPSGPKGEPGRDGPPGDLGKPGLPGIKGDRGTDGERGPNGDTGKPGLPGTKGEIGPAGPVGTSVISRVEGAKGNQGDRGQRGKPGPPGPPGPPSEPSKSGSSFSSQSGEESPKGVAPGIVTVTNMEALFKISDISAVGTIAYLYDEESLLLRVRKGWQYISMGKFVPLPTPTTTIPPPLTTLKKSTPSAAENMIPKIPRVPSLRLVALNEPLTGNMGGIQRVDSACYRQARLAGLRGTFRAFLASRVQKLDKIVRHPYRGYPVVNLRGEMLFRTWNDLFRGGRASELAPARQQRHDIYSFNNRNIFNDIVWPQKVVWHGAGPSGQRQLDSYCDAWTSSDAKTLGVAASLIASSPSNLQQQTGNGGGGGKLLAQDKFSCQNRFVVLCIEATSQVVASGWLKRAAEHLSE